MANDQWVLANDQWVLKHAQYVKAKVVLIIPAWELADFWPVIIRLAVHWIESNVLRASQTLTLWPFDSDSSECTLTDDDR